MRGGGGLIVTTFVYLIDHVCGESLKSKSRVESGHRAPYMKVLYHILCSEWVLYEDYYVLLVTWVLIGSWTAPLFSFPFLFTTHLPLCELSSQYEAYKTHLLSYS